MEQCAEFLRSHNYENIEAVNTARAARQVAQEADPTVAAIASEETAALYGREVLAEGINEQQDNSTRFVVLSKNQNQKVCKDSGTFIMMFAVKNEAGALVKVLNRLGEFGYNMVAIHSRPLKSHAWEYYFYIEVEGNSSQKDFEQMVHEIQYRCDKLKIFR